MKKTYKGKTTCPRCGESHADTLTVEDKIGTYSGPDACPKCGYGFEPEDFMEDGIVCEECGVHLSQEEAPKCVCSSCTAEFKRLHGEA